MNDADRVSCWIEWHTAAGAVARHLVHLTPDVLQATSSHALARRRTAFCAGYRAQREGAVRTSNPHTRTTGGWSRPLERCWYAGFDLAVRTVQ